MQEEMQYGIYGKFISYFLKENVLKGEKHDFS